MKKYKWRFFYVKKEDKIKLLRIYQEYLKELQYYNYLYNTSYEPNFLGFMDYLDKGFIFV